MIETKCNMWGLIVCGPGPFIHWGLKARAEKCYSPGSVIQVQKWPWDTAEDDSVLGMSEISQEGREKNGI